eukprot:gene5930-7382_t
MKYLSLLLVCTVFVLATSGFIFDEPQEYPLRVSSRAGIFDGFHMNETRAFLGVPYAQPPVGDLRFKPPQPRWFSWGVQQAYNMPASCFQSGAKVPNSYSEDCLYMNIYTPKFIHRSNNNAFSNLPVMVFIHGGRYWTGSAAEFQGDLLASVGNVVAISIQYRLNIFGFSALDGSTNNGLLDQQLALRWIQDNIRAFGGDPNRVTIFGESAGGSSVLHHLINPSSYNLYDRAILHSAWQWVIPTAETSRTKQIAYAATKGCNVTYSNGTPNLNGIIDCLKSKDPTSITPTAGQSDFFVPMVDNKFIKTLPLNAIKNKQYNRRADIIIGHNYDEGHFMAYSRLSWAKINDTVTDTTYYNSLTKYLNVYFTPEQTADIVNLYNPVKASVGNWLAGSEFFGDYYITCGSILAAKYLNNYGASLRTYIFNYSSTNYPAVEWFLAASHGNELPYNFFKPVYTPYEFTDSDYLMSTRMIRAWTDFADTGNPESTLAQWPSNPLKAMYFGPNAADFGANVDYEKPVTPGFCESWRQYYEQY